MITDAADFCRYTRSRKDMWWGTMLAGLLASLFSVSLGAYGAAASLGREANPFSLAAAVDPHWLTLLILLIVIALDETTINVMNLYTGGLSLSNLLEGPGRFWNTLFVGVVSTGSFGVAGVAGPAGAVDDGAGQLVCSAGRRVGVSLCICGTDAYRLFRRSSTLRVCYHYWHGVNVTAIVWCFLGGGIYYLLPMVVLPAVIVPLITGAGYLLTVRLLERNQVAAGKDFSLQASGPAFPTSPD